MVWQALRGHWRPPLYTGVASLGVLSPPIVGLAHHRINKAKAERADGVISDMLRAYAKGRKEKSVSSSTVGQTELFSPSTVGQSLHCTARAPTPGPG